MKQTLTAFLFLFACLHLHSQNYYTISFEGTGQDENDDRHELYIDFSSNPNNTWQIGPPQKTVFSSAYTVPNVIVTDTVDSYPANDTSSFLLKHVANLGFSMPSYVGFGGKYFVDSDTLTDYGLIEFSPDNGMTWIDLNDASYSGSIEWPEQPVLTGSSGEWKDFRADLTQLGPLFSIDVDDTVFFRFTFISDGIESNRDGLMFDSLYVYDVPPVRIEEMHFGESAALVYPNPFTTTVHFAFDQSKTAEQRVIIYDNLGRKMKEMTVPAGQQQAVVDMHDFHAGVYRFNVVDTFGHTIDSGRLVKSR